MALRVVLILTLLFASAASAASIGNGGFESGGCGFQLNGFVPISPGDTCLDGWTIIQDTIHYVGTGFWTAGEGQRSLDLDGPVGFSGGVAKTISTLPGLTYEVRFLMAGNPGNDPQSKRMSVSAAGQSAIFEFDITGRGLQDMGWVRRSWTFQAAGTSTTIEFRSLTESLRGWGPALDDVQVSALLEPNEEFIPEPGTFAVAASGLLALAWWRRRRA